eukprot:scaffold11728_cov32-Tisochrysis_lutea.AAC.5
MMANVAAEASKEREVRDGRKRRLERADPAAKAQADTGRQPKKRLDLLKLAPRVPRVIRGQPRLLAGWPLACLQRRRPVCRPLPMQPTQKIHEAAQARKPQETHRPRPPCRPPAA